MSNKPQQGTALKRALLALEKMQARLEAMEQARREPIAIIGIGCRFPGAENADEFWELLRDGADLVSEVPPERWNAEAYYDPDPDAAGKMYTRWGAFLEGVDQFDPQFFGITPREARSMDPQQRLLLEASWEALEDAALAPERLAGSRTGVFVGILGDDYGRMQLADGGIGEIDAYFGSGTARSIASGRISYVLGLEGPSVSIDTACSSSLVAIHQAVQSLRSGECDAALAGGVNVILAPEATIALSRHKMMASDGRCKTFDARADGYVRGEGVGMVVLKRLSDARRDGDAIWAVIRGSAVNQDGASSGLTAPNGPAQEAVIRAALADAQVGPQDVTYVECHGTGTSLGDPIEVQALAAVLGEGRPADKPLLLGSVKTNVGHLETAAGVVGLVKVVKMLQQRAIPPHLHLEQPNPFIPWDELPVVAPTTLTPWPAEAPPIAGLSSFGFSGTNVHLVLEAAPAREETPHEETLDRPAHLLTLSARNGEALAALARDYAALLGDGVNLADVAYTANTGRAQLPRRLALVAGSAAEASEALAAWAEGEEKRGVVEGSVAYSDPPLTAFLFTGQGAQYAGMGRQLYDTQPIFRRAVDECAELLRPLLERPLLEVLFADDEETAALVDQTVYTQPALFVIEYALAKLWMAWGIRPDYVMGHSIGEYVAACIAGVFSLEDGLKLIAARGRLMQELPAGGAMAAVFADEATVAEAIAPYPERMAIAAVNGPANVVISGEEAAVGDVVQTLQARGIKSRFLTVSHAFHSPLMAPMMAEFRKVAERVGYHAPEMRIVSTVSGQPVEGNMIATADYWCRQVRASVQFASAVETLYARRVDVLLEIGPQPTLLGMARRVLPEADDYEPLYIPSMRQNKGGAAAAARDAASLRQLLKSLSQLWVSGVEVDWVGFDEPYTRHKVRLPSYPFQRKRYWFSARRAVGPRTTAHAKVVHPLLGRRLRSALAEAQYESELGVHAFRFIGDHQVLQTPLLPMTAYLEMALAAAEEAFGPGAHTIEDVVIREPMVFADERERAVQFVVMSDAASDAEDVGSFKLFSQPGGAASTEADWQLHATGLLRRGGKVVVKAPDTVSAIQARCTNSRDAEEHYRWLSARGFDFGPALQGVVQVWWREGEVLAEVSLPEAVSDEGELFRVHPSLLDSCLQAFGAAMNLAENETYLPMSLGRIQVYGALRGRIWSHIVLESMSAETVNGHVRLLNDDGDVVMDMTDLAFRRTERRALMGVLGLGFADWYVNMSWQADDRQPVPVMATEVVASEVDARVDALCERHQVNDYHALFPKLEALSAAYVAGAFAELGWKFEPGQRVTAPALQEKLGVLTRYGRLLRRLLGILEGAGWLQKEGDGWIVKESPPMVDAASLAETYQSLLQEYPGSRAQITITGRCGPELAHVLMGRQDPLALLFPGGSVEVAEQLYRESPQARVFNDMVAEAVKEFTAQAPAERSVRMLEVGAGTGGTTSAVLPVLSAERTEYTFTDIGPLFLSRAEERFAQYDFVQYRTLDIERDPVEQGYVEGQYDIVLAVNVLHATTDLSQTLRHARALLAPGGVLLLVEGTAPENWVDITFGLTDGWWRFSDGEWREDYPLMDRERWSALLSQVGFRNVMALPAERDPLRQALIVAQAAPYSEPGHWLVLEDGAGVGRRLVEQLEAQGETCTRVPAPLSALNGGSAELLPSAVAYKAWLEEAGERPLRGVIHLWNLDAPDLDGLDSLEMWQRVGTGSVVSLIQALGERQDPPPVWLVTRGAQAVRDGDVPAIAQAPVWGLSKVIHLEHPELRTVCVDLEAQGDVALQARALFTELWRPDEETYQAQRGGSRHVARLMPAAIEPTGEQTAVRPVRLAKSEAGVLDEMSYVPIDRRVPGPGEVEIRVLATGLNFQDVMNALGMRDDPDPMGQECSGIVTAVGSDVEEFADGDEVMALVTGGFGTHVQADARFVAHKPNHLTFTKAAALPVAYFTAYYCLCHLGRLRAGERVLIHAASGGVGMAAVRVAQMVGAEVYATASRPKWEALRQAGVRHIFNSRTLDFADEILTSTDGAGVDVVLNSLAGEFVDKSMNVLAEGGRFLEIGKRDVWSVARFERERPDACYYLVDLAEEVAKRPESVYPVFREVMGKVAVGPLQPSTVRSFPMRRVASAFRYMAQAQHVGKIVVTQEDALQAMRKRIIPDATYLITGGTSGLGMLTAKWLVEKGARHLVLMARGRTAGEAQTDSAIAESIDSMKKRGAVVMVAQGDVSQAEDVSRVLALIADEMPPLRGIVHSAGVLDDAMLLRQNWDKFARVMAPKVDGAWLLHRQTEHLPLDFFVMYSSTSALTGSPGQSNHAAANTFMDALAQYRRAEGYPALSINWGVWSDVGSAAARGADEWVAVHGVRTISPEAGLDVLDELMFGGSAEGLPSGANIGVLPVDWGRYVKQFERTPAWLSAVARAGEAVEPRLGASAARPATRSDTWGSEGRHKSEEERTSAPAIRQALDEAPIDERREVLLDFVCVQVAAVVGLETEQALDPAMPLSDLGVDSLMAVELRNRLGRGLALSGTLPATLVFDYPTADALTDYLAVMVLDPAVEEESDDAPETTDILTAIENLSDEEVERLFGDLL